MPAPPLQPARVLLHVSFAAVPLGYWLAEVPRDRMLALASAGAASYVLLDAARLVRPAWNRWAFARLGGLLREREAGRLTGASYSLLALVVAVWAFHPRIVAAAFLYHSVGDAAAGWIGRRWGRHRIGDKSLEGSAALVVAGTAAAWPLIGGLPALVGALAAGTAELVLPLDDNLSVPLAAGGSVALLGRLAAGT